MRPLLLTLENLRSYRSRQVVSFADLGLFAITGSTGAGKSSLLEALVYALYGCCTFSKSSTKILISDGPGDPTMTVSLEFEARGQRWRVDRSCSKSNRASVHCLRRLDGEGAFDGEADVNRQVRELLGLDFDQFLKTVVLPQGRFAQLLDAKPAERSDVLKSLLGLDDVDRLLECVSVRAREVDRALAVGRDRRGRLPADPVAAVAAARAELEATRQAERAGAEQLQSVQALGTELERAQAELARLDEQIARASRLESDLGLRLAALTGLERELTDRSRALEAEEKRSQEARAEAERALQERESSGRTRSRLSQWLTRARMLGEVVPRLDRVGSELAEGRSELERRDQDEARLAEQAAALEAQRDQLKSEGQEARRVLDEARARCDEAGRWLESWQECRAQVERLRQRSKLEQAAHDQECLNLEGLEQSHARAQLEAAESKAELQRLEQEQRLATVAGHCAPDDPCPVCARPLPAGWEPPRGEGLAEAERALKLSESRVQNAYKAWQTELSNSQARAKQLVRLEGELREAADRLREKEARGRELLGDEADFDQFEECLLEPVRSRLREAEQARERLAERYQAVESDLKTHLATRAERRKSRDELAGKLRGLEGEQAELSARVEEARRELGESTVESLEAELWVAEGLDERLAACLGECHRLASARNDLHARRERELEQPRREVEKTLNDQRVVLAGLGVEVELAETLAASAERLDRARREALERWAGSRSARQSELEVRQAELGARLADLGASSLPELEQRARLGSDLRAKAEQALELEQARQQQAARLDRALEPVERLARNLEFLQSTLGNRGRKGRQSFSQWLLERRQGELLELASARLLEMTGGQYGFSPQFTIVDRHSGQSRKPETLSGGETFMASLALALALSELVGRKGGRLEAFFLDEGFGSLSPDCLDRALDALENLAGSGRLIGVISHVGAVAERLERVLQVSRTPQGSQVREVSGPGLRESAAADLDPAALALIGA